MQIDATGVSCQPIRALDAGLLFVFRRNIKWAASAAAEQYCGIDLKVSTLSGYLPGSTLLAHHEFYSQISASQTRNKWQERYHQMII